MEALIQQIETITKEIQNTVATTSAEVEAFRIKYLGTKGLVKNMMGEMKSVSNEQKKEFGQILNAFKVAAEENAEPSFTFEFPSGLLKFLYRFTIPSVPVKDASR